MGNIDFFEENEDTAFWLLFLLSFASDDENNPNKIKGMNLLKNIKMEEIKMKLVFEFDIENKTVHFVGNGFKVSSPAQTYEDIGEFAKTVIENDVLIPSIKHRNEVENLNGKSIHSTTQKDDEKPKV